MSKAVFVDKHVLQATADALTTLAGDLPGLLSAADRLGVGEEVGQLRAVPTWASETAADLRERVDLVERLEHGNTAFTSFGVSAEELRQLAGGSMPVDEQLHAIEAAETAGRQGEQDLLDWDGSQSFSDWIEKVEATAMAHLALLNDKGELIRKGIHAFNEHQDLLKTGGTALQGRDPVVRAQWSCTGIAAVDSFYLSGRRTLFVPGTSIPWLKAQPAQHTPKSQSSEHWDDVMHAAGRAGGWAGDTRGDAAHAVGDTTGGGVDAIRSFPNNPGTWF